MIKLFNQFNDTLKKLKSLKSNGQITDFRIFLRINNDIDVFILTDDNSFVQNIIDNENIRLTIINKNEFENDSYYRDIFETKKMLNISNGRRRFVNLLDYSDNDYTPPCPVVTFYSYKGGMGRSTFIAAAASHLAFHEKKKIVIIDCDFEAPGFTNFFLEEPAFPKHHNGVVEYLLDEEVDETIEVSQYMWEVSDKFSGNGEIRIMPAGNLDDETFISDEEFRTSKEHYLEGLARLDFASNEYIFGKFKDMIENIYQNIKPDLIFIDSRTGFNDVFGLTAMKMSNFMVGFFGITVQNTPGLHFFIDVINQIKKNFTGILVNSFSNHDDYKDFKTIVNEYTVNISGDEENSNNSENDNLEFGSINIDTFFFEQNNVLARLGTPNERINDFIALIEDKSLGRNYLNIFERILALSRNLNTTINEKAKQIEKLSTSIENKQIEQEDGAISKEQAIELKKNILHNLMENWPDMYAENIDFADEYSANRYFFRKCMQDLFNLNRFLVIGSKGTGKSYIYQSLKNENIVNELKRKANKTNFDYLFYPLIDKKENFLFVTDEFDDFNIEHSDLFYKRFWIVYTWNALMITAKKNNLGYKSNIDFFDIKNDTKTAKLFNDIISNPDKLIAVEEDLERLDKYLVTTNKYLIVIYDNLDEMVKPHKWDKQIAPLLNFWKFTSYKRIFSKLFVRKDLFDKIAGITNIEDLRNNAIDIEWSKEEIFAFFFKLIFAKSKEEFFTLMKLYNDFDTKTIKQLKAKSKNENQLPLEDSYLRKLSQTFFGQYAGNPKYGEAYDWLYKNLMNADETISVRPFIDLLEAAIKKWDNDVKTRQWNIWPIPILPYVFYTYRDVRKKAVERHFNDLAKDKGNKDLKKIFDFIDKYSKYQYYEYNEKQLDELLNEIIKHYSDLENNTIDELKQLLLVNAIIRKIPYRGGKKYTFAFLYKYRLGLRGRKQNK